ncbi:ABC transporter permease [Butyrivibrio sp. WCD3002]|uniref:ABC transporter permease n=1 Tax=Butyrivibrio sp. WCD3002 TaxID=1280676 RepID=UPI0003F87A1F|nr:ABC transporter permease subunit [Butyrivibrio sp. WCD3002]
MKKKHNLKRDIPFFIMLLPAMIYLLINSYFPMFGIFIAFKNINYQKGIFGSDWAGFKNFEFLFKTKDAGIMLRNTLGYNVLFIVLGIVLSVTLAIMLNEVGRTFLAKIAQPLIIFPNIISMVIVAYIVFAFLNAQTGFIDKTILKNMPISWYSEPKYWPVILTIVNIWRATGYGSIIYMSSIAGIDAELYEAARVDGATRLQQIFHIMIPLLKPTVVIMVLMAISKIFNSDFGLFYQVPMNSGALYNTTQTIDTYVYRALMELSDIGMSSAASVFQSVVGFVLVLTANKVVAKVDADNRLF